MKAISLIILTAMLFYSCTSTHMIKHDQSAYDELNQEIEGDKAKITFSNDEVMEGENIILGLDSTSWGKIEKWSVPTSHIKKIHVGGNLGQGALGGLFYGFIFGAIIGTIFGLSVLSTSSESDRYDGLAIGGGLVLAGGLAGAVIFLPFGLLAGGTDAYILKKIQTDTAETNSETSKLIK